MAKRVMESGGAAANVNVECEMSAWFKGWGTHVTWGYGRGHCTEGVQASEDEARRLFGSGPSPLHDVPTCGENGEQWARQGLGRPAATRLRFDDGAFT